MSSITDTRSPIDEILASRRQPAAPDTSGRYGEGRRYQQEREDVRESYLAMDVRLHSGEFRGFFYFDLTGSPKLDADHTTLTVPFRSEKLVIQGYRLLELYRAILHHSLDVLEETHRPEFAGQDSDRPIIESIAIVDQKGEQ